MKPCKRRVHFPAESLCPYNSSVNTSDPAFETVWQRIALHAGQTFHQKQGNPFTYSVTGKVLRPDRTDRNLPYSQFEKAYARLPVDGPGKLQDLQGPSYLYAILTDPRIAA